MRYHIVTHLRRVPRLLCWVVLRILVVVVIAAAILIVGVVGVVVVMMVMVIVIVVAVRVVMVIRERHCDLSGIISGGENKL